MDYYALSGLVWKDTGTTVGRCPGLDYFALSGRSEAGSHSAKDRSSPPPILSRTPANAPARFDGAWPKRARRGMQPARGDPVCLRLHGSAALGLRAAPLLPAAAGLIAGVVADHHLQAAPVVYLSVLAGVSFVTLFRSARARVGPGLICAAAASAGACLHLQTARVVPPAGIARHTLAAPRIARLRGRVVTPPRIPEAPPSPFRHWQYRGDRTAFLVDAEAIESAGGFVPVTGRVRVSVHEVVLDLREGEPVELFGKLYRIPPPSNPGGFDWATYYHRQGIVAGFTCNLRENVRRLAPTASRRPMWLTRLRDRVRALLVDDLITGAEPRASLLEAMILGHRSRLDWRLNDIFVRAGCMHHLAVSGTHVVILLSFVWGLGRLCGMARRRGALLVAAVVVGYTLVTEPRPPILRATIMTLLFSGALLFQRTRAPLNWVAAAAVVLVAADPAAVFDVGFQLSFAAVLGVMYLAPATWSAASAGVARARRLGPGRLGGMAEDAGEPRRGGPSTRRRPAVRAALRKGGRIVALAFAVSVAAWLASAPIVAAAFGRVQPWGAVNSVLVFPLVYATMIVGLAKVALAPVSPTLASLLGPPLGGLDRGLIGLADRLGALPGASLVAAPPAWWLLIAYYAVLLLFIYRFRPTDAAWRFAPGLPGPAAAAPPRIPRALNTALAAGFAFVALGLVAGQRPRQAADRLAVTVLAVGAGTATVIEFPDGCTWLYDTGSSDPFDVGRSVVVPYLRQRRIASIDRVFLSHPNLDHFSDLPAVLEEIAVGGVLVNRHFRAHSPPRSAAARLLEVLAERGHGVDTVAPPPLAWTEGAVGIEWLWPPDAAAGGLAVNETSTVLRLSYAGRSILLTGDIEEQAQQALLRRGGLAADVLVLPHHGAVQPNSKSFVDAVGATVLVRSSREPMAETSDGLWQAVGRRPIYNTADYGAVEIVIDADGVRVSTSLQAPH